MPSSELNTLDNDIKIVITHFVDAAQGIVSRLLTVNDTKIIDNKIKELEQLFVEFKKNSYHPWLKKINDYVIAKKLTQQEASKFIIQLAKPEVEYVNFLDKLYTLKNEILDKELVELRAKIQAIEHLRPQVPLKPTPTIRTYGIFDKNSENSTQASNVSSCVLL
jgi:hypothetical protein